MGTALGQNVLRTVDTEQISNPFWSKVSTRYLGKTKLPYMFKKGYETPIYTCMDYEKKYMDLNLPLSALPDTEINDSEQLIMAAFYNTNGNYFLSIIEVWSGDHNHWKYLLVTFNFEGKALDHLVFHDTFNAHPNDVNTVESRLNKDLTIDTNIIKLNEDYPVKKDFQVKPNLHGQRIDRHYRITPQGKFELTSEVKYQPQNYTAKELAGTNCIADGMEKRLTK